MALLRAGIVGYGTMGRQHARVLANLEGVELVGVVDSDASSTPDGVLGSVEALIARGIDYCVVAVPTASHEEVGLMLAQAGIHALIEKPLAGSFGAASRLQCSFEEHGLIAGVGHVERFNPAFEQARDRVLDGAIGEIVQIASRRQGPRPARIVDVGVVMDLATHDIDVASWITQSPFVSVSAKSRSLAGHCHEDFVSAVGLLGNGVVTSHLVDWISPRKERVTVITGEKGAFVVDSLTADLSLFALGTAPMEWEEMARTRGETEGDVTHLAIAKREPLRLEHENFRNSVLGRSSRTVSLTEGVATLQVAEAILESARTGETVVIPPVAGSSDL